MIEALSCTASLYRWISLTWCLPPPGYLDTAAPSRILSREPPQHFSCFSAVFQGWSFIPHFDILSEVPPLSFSLPSKSLSIDSYSHCRDLGMLYTYLPTRHEHSVSSVFSCLLLQLPADIRTTLALFIFHNYNFSSSEPVGAELLKLTLPPI